MKLLDVLNELMLIKKDLDRIESWGEQLVEEYEVGPFTVFLTKSKYTNRFQVGLTSNEQECSSAEAQQKKESCVPTHVVMQSYPRIVRKVGEWIDQFGTLNVGSWNGEKTVQYRKIFNRFGLNCTPIESAMGGFIFQVSK
jgi:hypothetical protein